MKVNSFTGKYRFLSNFFLSPISIFGIDFPSVENAYQAAKCDNPEDRWKFRDITPGAAKKLGRTVKLRADWESIKLNAMLDLLRLKFKGNLGFRLINTKDWELIEGNPWGDTFWGVCRGVGENHLGKLLMQVRQELHDNPIEQLTSCQLYGHQYEDYEGQGGEKGRYCPLCGDTYFEAL